LTEFTKPRRSLRYWLSKWKEVAFAEKFGMSPDRVINEVGDGWKEPKAIALKVIKEWLKPQSYKVTKEEDIKDINTDMTVRRRGYTEEKDGAKLRVALKKNLRLKKEILDNLLSVEINSTNEPKKAGLNDGFIQGIISKKIGGFY
jgi:hypothetical protein